MDNQQSYAKIREFISRRLHAKGDEISFNNSDLLVTGGRLDSLDIVEIVLFLEEEFGLNFAKIGFDRSYVDSVDALAQLIIAHAPHS